jgi:hypothetical protein
MHHHWSSPERPSKPSANASLGLPSQPKQRLQGGGDAMEGNARTRRTEPRVSPDPSEGNARTSQDHASKKEAAPAGIAVVSVRSRWVGFSPGAKSVPQQAVDDGTWRLVTGLQHHHRENSSLVETGALTSTTTSTPRKAVGGWNDVTECKVCEQDPNTRLGDAGDAPDPLPGKDWWWYVYQVSRIGLFGTLSTDDFFMKSMYADLINDHSSF